MKALLLALLNTLKPYLVIDSHGTNQRAWTLEGAMTWLPYCADSAAVWCRVSKRPVVARLGDKTLFIFSL